MAKVLDPAKELRFTRTAQATLFAIVGAVFLCVGIMLSLVTGSFYHYEGSLETLPFPLILVILPWLPTLACFWLCYYCARYPYLLFSPIGIEVFPFWKPVKNFNLIEWGRVVVLEYNETQLILHHNAEKTSGVVLSLSPLNKKSRMLLIRTVEGVMEQQKSK